MISLAPESDGLPDDRITCQQCTAMSPSGKGGVCSVFQQRTLLDLPRRCIHFVPIRGAADQRTGKQRWPHIVEQVAEIRELDRQHREAAHGG